MQQVPWREDGENRYAKVRYQHLWSYRSEPLLLSSPDCSLLPALHLAAWQVGVYREKRSRRRYSLRGQQALRIVKHDVSPSLEKQLHVPRC